MVSRLKRVTSRSWTGLIFIPVYSYLFYDKHYDQFTVLETRIDGLSPDCQLQPFTEKCTPCTTEYFIADANLSTVKRMDTGLWELCWFKIVHLLGKIQNGLLYAPSNKNCPKWKLLRLWLVPHPAKCSLPFLCRSLWRCRILALESRSQYCLQRLLSHLRRTEKSFLKKCM